mgnify:CR=1 FL=1
MDLDLIIADVSRHSEIYEDLNKLKDKSIKAVFIVNPNNPASIALNDDCRNTLKNIVTKYNPNLMIITDDVYCTFVNNFKSVISDLPYNTIGVYSLSKYFGVTGWRLGAIILNENNIYNKLICELPETHKDTLNKRYCHLSSNPEELSFMDRLVADSRQVCFKSYCRSFNTTTSTNGIFLWICISWFRK